MKKQIKRKMIVEHPSNFILYSMKDDDKKDKTLALRVLRHIRNTTISRKEAGCSETECSANVLVIVRSFLEYKRVLKEFKKRVLRLRGTFNVNDKSFKLNGSTIQFSVFEKEKFKSKVISATGSEYSFIAVSGIDKFGEAECSDIDLLQCRLRSNNKLIKEEVFFTINNSECVAEYFNETYINKLIKNIPARFYQERVVFECDANYKDSISVVYIE